MNYNTIVWICFAIMVIPFTYFASKKYLKVNKQKKEAIKELNDKKEYYRILTKEKLDACPREDLATAAVVHLLRKESEDYDHVYDNLNESERIVYIIYESMISIENGKGTIRTFFENDYYKDFFPMIDKAYDAIDCKELGEMMRACRHLQYIIENDIDDDEDTGDYSNYNFGDFTNEFMTLIMTLNVNELLTNFIDQHRDDFIDEEEKEEGDIDENISE